MNACPKQSPALKDKKHTKFMHQLVCLICGNPEVVQHHLMRCRTRRGQYRAGDNQSVPLCVAHHDGGPESLHKSLKRGIDEREYFAMHGIHDAEGAADDLYANTGDYVACMAIIAAAKKQEM